MNGKVIKEVATKLFFGSVNWCADHKAEIFTGVAMTASTAAMGLAIAATKDAIPEIEHHKKNIELIKRHKDEDGTYYHDELVDKETMEIETTALTGQEADKQYKKDLTHEYLRLGGTIAKRYAIPTTIELLALSAMFASNKVSRKDKATLAMALTGVQAAYDRLNNNLIEAVGEDKARDIRLGIHDEKITEEEIDEDGKKKKVKKDVKVVDPDKIANPWTFIYDEKADNFNKSKGCNRQTLMIRQANWNDYLMRHKRVFVNQVLEDIGLGCYCSPMGQVYGWIYDDSANSTKQNYISFNIEDNARFMGNYDPSVVITLNPDGNILEEAFMNKPIVTKKAWAGASY